MNAARRISMLLALAMGMLAGTGNVRAAGVSGTLAGGILRAAGICHAAPFADPTGACCLLYLPDWDAYCADLPRQACDDLIANPSYEGTYEGDGTVCLGDGDGDGVDDACPCPCNCDVNDDGMCELGDFLALADCIGEPPTGPCQRMDVNCDGVIDEWDLCAVLCRWEGGGSECCDPLTCGACCFSAGGCEIRTESNCIWSEGIFKGGGMECLGDSNENGIDDACEPALRPMPEDCETIDPWIWCSDTGICTTDDDCTFESHCVLPPMGEPGLGVCYAPKTRYISIARHPGQWPDTARRVKLDTGQVLGWVGEPYYNIFSAQPEHGYWVADVVPEPHYESEWPEVVHVKGCEIGNASLCDISGSHCHPFSCPGGETCVHHSYHVQAIRLGDDTDDAAGYSEVLELRTNSIWGDVLSMSDTGVCEPPDGVPGLDDWIACIVALQCEFDGAAPESWLDSAPETPDGVVNIEDVLVAVYGTQGLGYPYPGPLNCPVCGNGDLEPTEQCDDGNTISGDGCDEYCRDEIAPTMEIHPNRASGTAGVDWQIGPGNEIILAHGDQLVEVELFLSEWDGGMGVELAGYRGTLDCASFATGGQGTLVPIDTPCDFENDPERFCIDVDTGREDFVFYDVSDSVRVAGSPLCPCPDSSPGRFADAASVYSEEYAVPDTGTPAYGGTFAVEVPADAAGSFELTFDPDPGFTFMRSFHGLIVPLSPVPAVIIVRPPRPMGEDCHELDAPEYLNRCSSSPTCLTDLDCAFESHCVLPPVGEEGPGVCYAPKTRYLSIARNPEQWARTARRVSLSDGTLLGWVGEPYDSGGLIVANIVDVPTYDQYDTPGAGEDGFGFAWPDVVHVNCCPVAHASLCPDMSTHCLPNACPGGGGCTHYSYQIQAILAGEDIGTEAGYSEALELHTNTTWGDTVSDCSYGVCKPPDGFPGLNDIMAAIDYFMGSTAIAPITWLDIDPSNAGQCPEQVIGLGDIMAAIAGFQGEAYPGLGPLNCP